VCAEQELNTRGGVGYLLIRRASADDDQIDLLRIHTGARQCPRRRDVGQHRHGHVRNPAFFDSCTAGDPLIVGFEKRGKTGIVEHGRRHALAPTGDGGVFHSGIRFQQR
jgi:hypothetical protein